MHDGLGVDDGVCQRGGITECVNGGEGGNLRRLYGGTHGVWDHTCWRAGGFRVEARERAASDDTPTKQRPQLNRESVADGQMRSMSFGERVVEPTGREESGGRQGVE